MLTTYAAEPSAALTMSRTGRNLFWPFWSPYFTVTPRRTIFGASANRLVNHRLMRTRSLFCVEHSHGVVVFFLIEVPKQEKNSMTTTITISSRDLWSSPTLPQTQNAKRKSSKRITSKQDLVQMQHTPAPFQWQDGLFPPLCHYGVQPWTIS